MSIALWGRQRSQPAEAATFDTDSVEPAEEMPKEGPLAMTPDPLDEDLYGLAITSIVRDTERLVAGTEAMYLRISRMGVSMVVLVFSMILQVYLLVEMRRLVTSVAVHQIRLAYDHYEVIMYGNKTSRMDTSSDGFFRGVPVNFEAKNFGLLRDEDKQIACRIPLSQPTFFMTILLVWSFTVISDIRKAIDLSIRLLSGTPTTDSMRAATEPLRGGDDGEVVIVGLTRLVKSVLLVVLFMPRIGVDCILLWLGCRWLAATPSFEDLILNAVALEFILHLNGILAAAMVPHRNKVETRKTYVAPFSKEESVTPWVFMSTFMWGMVGMSWVLLYMYVFQQVLPDYKWDIQDACLEYLKSLSESDRI